jgi:hypothetical protein
VEKWNRDSCLFLFFSFQEYIPPYVVHVYTKGYICLFAHFPYYSSTDFWRRRGVGSNELDDSPWCVHTIFQLLFKIPRVYFFFFFLSKNMRIGP